MDDVAHLHAALDAIGAAWTSGRTDELRAWFHPDIVIVGPDLQRYAIGRDACVASYHEFTANAEVLAYDAGEPDIGVWGATAVVAYQWTMTWRRPPDPPATERGVDQFVFTRDGDRWLAVHRLVAPLP